MTVQNINKNEKGFTLIELLVVIGILAILLAITLIAINPARQFGQANDTKRRSDINAILNAVGQYTASNQGQLPNTLQGATVSATRINSTNFPSSATGLCNQLVTTYISALPVDPSTPAANNATPNSSSGVTDCTLTWDTGYSISKDSGNRITVSATSYDGSTPITVTR